MARELAFTREEYERRLGRVREEMAARGLDVLLAVNPVSTKYHLSAGDHERLAAALACIRSAAGSEFPCLSPVVTTGVRSGVPHTTYRAMSPRRNGRYGIAG